MKGPEPGRSWRTPAKHDLMCSLIGKEVGVAKSMPAVGRSAWFDLTAGDGVPPDGLPWERNCSPGILAYHARNLGKPVDIALYEIKPAHYDRLLRSLEARLPALEYQRHDEGTWYWGPAVRLRAIFGSGGDADLSHVRRGDAVFALNDPNAITDWAMRDSFADEVDRITPWFRSLSTLGCNPGGLKRLDAEVRQNWFALLDNQERSQPRYRDLLLAAIERDDAQLGLLDVGADEVEAGHGDHGPYQFQAVPARHPRGLVARRRFGVCSPEGAAVPHGAREARCVSMTQLGPYEVHPFADSFPLLEGEEFDKLVLDIKRQGLRQPIVITHDKTILVDGRNRYRACDVAGVDLVFETLGERYTEPMILDLIVSLNLERRHLNAGQKAMVSLEYEKAFAASTKRGPSMEKSPDLDSSPSTKNDRKSAARAARVTGASRSAVAQAKAVQRDAPDLAAKVKSGEMALDKADRERKERVKHEPKPEPIKSGPTMLTLLTHTGDRVAYPEPKGRATFNQTTGEGISWASWSWNPVTGCLHGCDYCYAREIATKDSYAPWFPVGFTPLFHTERLDAPANTSIPLAHRDDPSWQRVFVCSMADLYGRWVPDEWIEQVHGVCRSNPQWQYLMLTKFPARYVGLSLPPTSWLGTSVDEQKRVRIAEDAFRQVEGVSVKWLSLEPLREPLEFADLSMFDWVVIGAQTETRQPDGRVKSFAPPFEWVSRIVAQAREAGCRIHLKPNLLGSVGPANPGMELMNEYPEPRVISA